MQQRVTDLLHFVLIAVDKVLNATVTYDGGARSVTRGRPLCSLNASLTVTASVTVTVL